MKRFFSGPKANGKIFSILAITFIGMVGITMATFPAPYLKEPEAGPEKNKVTYDAAFVLNFSQKMSKKSVEEAFKISPKIEGSFSWPNSNTLVFKPKNKLKLEDEYQLEIKNTARSLWRKKLKTDIHLQYIVAGPPFVLFHDPADKSLIEKGEKITVMFDRPMNFSESKIEELINIEPETEGELKLIGKSAFQFTPQGWKPGQEYTIKVPTGLTAMDGGKTVEEKKWTVRSPLNTVIKTNPGQGEGIETKTVLEIEFENPVDLGKVRPGQNALLYPSNDLKGRAEEEKEDGFFNTEVRYKENEQGELQKNILLFSPAFPYQTGIPHEFILKSGADFGLEEDFVLRFSAEESVDTAEEEAKSENEKDELAWESEGQITFFVQGEKPNLRLKNPLKKTAALSVCQVSSSEFIEIQLKEGFENYNCPEKTVELKPAKEGITVIDLNEHFKKTWGNGIYYASLTSGEDKIWVNFLIQDTALLFQRSNQDLLLWANDIRSGKPLANQEIEFLSSEGVVIETGKTDKNGLYISKNVLLKGLWARVKSSQAEGMVKPWGLAQESWNSLSSQGTQEIKEQVVLVPDENYFEAGEEVTLAGLYRIEKDHQLSYPEDKEVNLVLQDLSEREMVVNTTPVKNSFFQHQLKLPRNLSDGHYHIHAENASGEILSKPVNILIGTDNNEIRFDLLNQKNLYASPDIALELRAKQKKGLPIPDLKAKYRLSRIALRDSFKNHFDYTFHPLRSDCSVTCEQTGVIKEGEIEFDTQGKTILNLKEEAEFLWPGYHYILELNPEKSEGWQTIGFDLDQGFSHVGLKVRHAFLRAGDSLEVDLLHFDQDMKPKARQLSISVLDPKERNKVLYKKTINTEAGSGSLSIPVSSSWPEGIYVVRAEALESGKNAVRAEKEIYLLENRGMALAGHFLLAADQTSYPVGGRADFILNDKEASSQSPVKVLISYEGQGLLKQEWITLKNPITEFSLPIEAHMTPHVDVNVMKFKAGTLPEYEKKSVRVHVEDESSAMKLEVNIEPKEPKAGDLVKLSLKTVDLKNQGLPAAIVLNVVEGEGYSGMDLKNFFGSRGTISSTGSNVSLIQSISVDPDDFSTSHELGNPSQSIYFNGELETDAQGQAYTEFKLPETGSNFHFYASAVSGLRRSAEIRGSLNENVNLKLQAIEPEFLMANDHSVIGAQVENTSSQEISTKIEIKVQDAALKGEKAQSISLKPGEKKEVFFPIVIDEKANKSHLIYYLYWDNKSLNGKIPLRHLSLTQDLMESKLIKEVWSGRITMPPGAYPGSGWLTFLLSGNTNFALKTYQAKIEELKDDTIYGLYYQLLSRLLDEEDKAAENSTIPVLVDKISRKANEEGAYSFLKGGEASPMLTAKIMLAFSQIEDIEEMLGQDKISQTLEYLLKLVDRPELTLSDRFFILWSLSQHEQYDTAKSLELFKQRQETDWQGKAFLLLTFEALKRAGQVGVEPFIEKFKDELKQELVINEDQIYAPDGKKSVLTTALVLYALAQTDAERELLEGMSHYLTAHQTEWNLGFDAEQNFWINLTLKKVAELKQSRESNFFAKVTLNGDLIMDQSITPQAGGDVHESIRSGTILKKEGVNDLFVLKEGNGDLYFDAQMKSYLNPKEAEGVEEGVILHREILSAANNLKKGETYRERLTLIVSQDLTDVMIRNPQVATLRLLDNQTSLENLPFEGWEIKENEIRYYATKLPAGVYELEYEFQPILAGSYHQLPATLKSFVHTNHFAQSQGNLIHVTE